MAFFKTCCSRRDRRELKVKFQQNQNSTKEHIPQKDIGRHERNINSFLAGTITNSNYSQYLIEVKLADFRSFERNAPLSRERSYFPMSHENSLQPVGRTTENMFKNRCVWLFDVLTHALQPMYDIPKILLKTRKEQCPQET